MARHNPHLKALHSIIRRNAESQMLYAFVLGVTAVDDTISTRRAIVIFKNTFEIEDLDVNSSITKFHRMRSEALRDQNILKQ